MCFIFLALLSRWLGYCGNFGLLAGNHSRYFSNPLTRRFRSNGNQPVVGVKRKNPAIHDSRFTNSPPTFRTRCKISSTPLHIPPTSHPKSPVPSSIPIPFTQPLPRHPRPHRLPPHRPPPIIQSAPRQPPHHDPLPRQEQLRAETAREAR